MASLSELQNFLAFQQQQQEASNPLFALAEGVEQGFEQANAIRLKGELEEQKERIKAKQIERNNALVRASVQGKNPSVTNGTTIQTLETSDEANKRRNTKTVIRRNVATGELKGEEITLSPSEQRQENLDFDAQQVISGKLSIERFEDNHPLERNETDKLRLILMENANATNEVTDFVSNQANLNASKIKGSVISRDGGFLQKTIVTPDIDTLMRPKGGVVLEDKRILDEQAADIEIQKAAGSQKAKAGELAAREFPRAFVASDTAFDEALNSAEVIFDKFGVKPGNYLGLFEKAIPSQFNEHKDALIGAGKESAALIARQVIPGVRSAQITKIFEKSTAAIGKTMEANARNVAASMGTAFGNALINNIEGMQNVYIDKETGKTISKLPFEDRLRGFNTAKRNFANKVEDDYLNRVFDRNTDLLQADTVIRMREQRASSMSPTDRKKRIEELQSRSQ